MTMVGMWWDSRLFLGQLAMHSVLNDMNIVEACEQLDSSTFGNQAHVWSQGLFSVSFDFKGRVEMTDDGQEEVMSGNVATANIPVTMMLTNTPAVGDRARFFVSQQAAYQFGAPHGQLLNFTANGLGSNGHRLIPGYVLEVGDTARTSTFNGAQTSNPGAVSATQYLYAVLHVWSASATDTLDVIVQSAATGDAPFAAPTTRITFAQKTAVGHEYATRVAGAITDTRWRISATIAGVDPSFKFAVAIGII